MTISCDPLTPTAFLNLAAAVHPDRIAMVDGDERFTYTQLIVSERPAVV